MEVLIFDNLNTFINYAVELLKNIVTGLREFPDLIGDSLVRTAELTEHFPPMVTWLVLFTAGTGIMLKVTHWGYDL